LHNDREVAETFSPGGSERMTRSMRLIETGRVDPLPMTTHRFNFDDIERAFRMMQTKEDGMTKPLILFEG
jgi:isopropanol dehydrogenase (NADP+)